MGAAIVGMVIGATLVWICILIVLSDDLEGD